MRNYELTLVLSPLLEEQEVNDTLQTVASAIQDKGGILGEQAIKGKQALQAAIQGQHEGYLAVLAFTMAAGHLQEVEKTWKEHTRVLRFLLAQQRKRAAKVQAVPVLSHATESSGKKVNAQPAMLTPETRKKEDKPARPPNQGASEARVDLKDIDKKLEEIFKEAQ